MSGCPTTPLSPLNGGRSCGREGHTCALYYKPTLRRTPVPDTKYEFKAGACPDPWYSRSLVTSLLLHAPRQRQLAHLIGVCLLRQAGQFLHNNFNFNSNIVLTDIWGQVKSYLLRLYPILSWHSFVQPDWVQSETDSPRGKMEALHPRIVQFPPKWTHTVMWLTTNENSIFYHVCHD